MVTKQRYRDGRFDGEVLVREVRLVGGQGLRPGVEIGSAACLMSAQCPREPQLAERRHGSVSRLT